MTTPAPIQPLERATLQGMQAEAKQSQRSPFKALQDPDEFTQLFIEPNGNPWDFIYAPHPGPGAKPEWKTESEFPLTDRLIRQGAYLYGVRPGNQTAFGLADIDRGSPYHPANDPIAYHRLLWVFEPLGLENHLIITSSTSKGLHLYFPFERPFSSWQIAACMTVLAQNAGFHIKDGWLEIFPNLRAYSSDGPPSLRNAHRLPLQFGSCLLNEDLEPVFARDPHATFVQRWYHAAAHNEISESCIKTVLKQYRREYAPRMGSSGAKYLEDLRADIAPGWTGPGETNRILGLVARYAYVFAHVIDADQPLTDGSLVQYMTKMARALPGFEEYCAHKDSLEMRCRHWARSIESCPKYYPYGGKRPSDGPSWNEIQQSQARDRIREALAKGLETGELPAGITERMQWLRQQAGSSPKTLYRHRDLWHPQAMQDGDSSELHPTSEGNPMRSAESPTTSPITPGSSNKLPSGGGGPSQNGQTPEHSMETRGVRGDFPKVSRELRRSGSHGSCK